MYRLPNNINRDHSHLKPMELRLGLHTHPALEKAEGSMDYVKLQLVQKLVHNIAQVVQSMTEGSPKEGLGGPARTASSSEDPMRSAEWDSFVCEVLQEDDALLLRRGPCARH